MSFPLKPVLKLRAVLLLLAGALTAFWALDATPEKWRKALESVQASPAADWPWQAYAALWLPRAAAVDAVLLLILAVLAPWLLQPAPALPRPAAAPAMPGPRWLVPVVLAGVMLLSAWHNAPRLDDSLWSDEEFSMSHFMVGEYTPEKDGKMKWRPVPWSRAFFDHRVPNNHSAYSVLARLAHTGCTPPADPASVYFSETRLRLPAFLAGLLSLPALYLLLRELGLPRAGWAGVVLLALHPWFVRYTTEARSYGLVFLWWPLAVFCLLRALRSGQWRWWAGWGLLQTLLLWSWTGMVHWLLALNAAASVSSSGAVHPPSAFNSGAGWPPGPSPLSVTCPLACRCCRSCRPGWPAAAPRPGASRPPGWQTAAPGC